VGISVVILSFNSEGSIANTLGAAAQVSDDIHIVDSFSLDRTVEIARSAGAVISQRKFANYADQRNWAIENLPCRYEWQLHLDADEILSKELIAEISILDNQWPDGVEGFLLPRLTRFMGRELRHGGYYPTYHMRLFRKGAAKVENRLYDQHFILKGSSATLKAPMIDDHRMTLSEWTARHNKWSDFEVEDLLHANTQNVLQPNIFGDKIERARSRKSLYYNSPIFIRAFLLFLYRYIILAGFLDGTPGFIYCFLQSCWFRFLVDAKLFEKRITSKTDL
jgi:glycosyltransferase involved in cell wall biosynthesis